MKRDWKKTKAVNKLKKHKAMSSNAVLISAWVAKAIRLAYSDLKIVMAMLGR